ncbi:hypothetical protein SS50377_25778 [Spironucleus salmonicida]|uniref:Transmembrane protein n=1 Tax=Spironucleus salmonicida TaxID=348837 RepID=V6LX11_9EUKA|nr:hypothetical protein SS50377_25778 [Spironucleus salmonicida]|eukprot:EST48246.1 Hypothetical protein SS50377_fx013 [Spironucleus salmonicida]
MAQMILTIQLLTCEVNYVIFNPIIYLIDINLTCNWQNITFMLEVGDQQQQFEKQITQIQNPAFQFQILHKTLPLFLNIYQGDIQLQQLQVYQFKTVITNPITCIQNLFVSQSQLKSWLSIQGNFTKCVYDFSILNWYFMINQVSLKLKFNQRPYYSEEVLGDIFYYPILYVECKDDQNCQYALENIYHFEQQLILNVGKVNISYKNLTIFTNPNNFNIEMQINNKSVDGDVDFQYIWGSIYVSTSRIMRYINTTLDATLIKMSILLYSSNISITLVNSYDNIQQFLNPFHFFICEEECLALRNQTYSAIIKFDYFLRDILVQHNSFYMKKQPYFPVNIRIDSNQINVISDFISPNNISLLFGDSILIPFEKYMGSGFRPMSEEGKKQLKRYPQLLQKYNKLIVILENQNQSFFVNNIQTFTINFLILILMGSVILVTTSLVMFMLWKLK